MQIAGEEEKKIRMIKKSELHLDPDPEFQLEVLSQFFCKC